MYLNSMSVKVVGGSEKTSGYVEMAHGQQYSLSLRNDRNVRTDAEVTIDGKKLGVFRINANETIRLDRPLDDDGRFTFYRLGSCEAQQADLDEVSQDNLGLIKVVFRPEKVRAVRPVTPWVDPYPYIPPYTKPWPYIDIVPWRDTTTITWTDANTGKTTYTDCSIENSMVCADSVGAGGTGLSGRSDQAFFQVDELDYDLSQETTIYLRLVEKKDRPNVRPLKPVMRSTPIPPSVEEYTYTNCGGYKSTYTQ